VIRGQGGSNQLKFKVGGSGDDAAATGGVEALRITSGGELKIPAGIGPQITFENQHGNTGDAVISTFDDGVGTLLCLGSNFYFSSAGAESRYNTSEESAGIIINRTGNIDFNTGDTSATATSRLRINSDGRVLINATNNPTIGGQTPYLYVSSYTNLDGLRIRGLDTGNTIWKDGGHMSITVASAHSIYLKTQSATALQVTANGQVLTSLQPRFLARLNANVSYDPSGFGNHVHFDYEDYDIGGNFTTSGADEGLFTAPISGMYAFSAASYAPGTNQTQSWFTVNSSRKAATDWVPNQQGSFVQNFQIIYLSTGDKVGFHPHSAGTGYTVNANTHHTYFKGCLLG